MAGAIESRAVSGPREGKSQSRQARTQRHPRRSEINELTASSSCGSGSRYPLCASRSQPEPAFPGVSSASNPLASYEPLRSGC